MANTIGLQSIVFIFGKIGRYIKHVAQFSFLEMSQVIYTNIASLNAQRNFSKSQLEQGTALQRLSSGLRVNTAKDDAAGLAIATRMEAQSRGMSVAVRNVNDGISALSVADGGLAQATEMFQRIRELWVQGQNGTNSDSDKDMITREMQSMMNGIADIFNQTSFNGQKLLTYDGSTGSTLNTWSSQLQIGSNVGDDLEVKVFDASLDAFGDPTDYPNLISPSVTTPGTMQGSAIGLDSQYLINLEQSMNSILKARANIGAQLNRLDGVISNLQIANENTTAARGRIMDADYAAETASLTRAQILQNAGTATLAQANALPQQVLNLLPR